jgi:hypothetical protein
VVLLSPESRIGAGTLVVASANGDVRSVALERVWIGFESSDGSSSGDYVGTQRGAGVAVDPEGGRAFVFPAGSDAAAIDLDTLAVAYQPLLEPVSMFGRLRGFSIRRPRRRWSTARGGPRAGSVAAWWR